MQQQQQRLSAFRPVAPKKTRIPRDFADALHSSNLVRYYSESYVASVLQRAAPGAVIMTGRVFNLLMRVALQREWSSETMVRLMEHTEIHEVRRAMKHIADKHPHLIQRMPTPAVRRCLEIRGTIENMQASRFYTPTNTSALMAYLGSLDTKGLAAATDAVINDLDTSQVSVEAAKMTIQAAGFKDAITWEHVISAASRPFPFLDFVLLLISRVSPKTQPPQALYLNLIHGAPKWAIPATRPMHPKEIPTGGYASALMNAALPPYIVGALASGWPAEALGCQLEPKFGSFTLLHMLILRLAAMVRASSPDIRDMVTSIRQVMARMEPCQSTIRDARQRTPIMLAAEMMSESLVVALFLS